MDVRGGKFTIGDNVDTAHEVQIWTRLHDDNDANHGTVSNNVIINHHAWICMRAIILPDVSIGEGAVIAAGVVVTKDVPPLFIVSGVLGKIIEKRSNSLLYELKYRP